MHIDLNKCTEQRRDAYSRDSIDNTNIFSLHLALNTCHDKGIQSFLTIPDIEQNGCEIS